VLSGEENAGKIAWLQWLSRNGLNGTHWRGHHLVVTTYMTEQYNGLEPREDATKDYAKVTRRVANFGAIVLIDVTSTNVKNSQKVLAKTVHNSLISHFL